MSPRPERAYESAVVALWPQFGEDFPDQFDLDKTYNDAVSSRRLNLDTGEWEPIGRTATRALLRIVCSARHDRGGGPMLAEIWRTPRGPFFLSRLPGAVRDPPNHPNDPFAPPTPVLSAELKKQRRAITGDAPGYGRLWRPVPVTVVRLFLEDPLTNQADLWVKCAQHGPGLIDRLQLLGAYAEDRTRRQQFDTPRVTVRRLNSVGALSWA